jgi:hypothetical protein
MSASVLILNAGYEPIQQVSLQHAITMLYRQVAVIEVADTTATFGVFPRPKVLRLTRYINMKWRHGRTPIWTRAKLLKRDSNQCAYCLKPADTVDHLLPVSRGGDSSWLNTVASCRPCNSKKRNRTPGEANMKLLAQPFVPAWDDVFTIAVPYEITSLAS